MSHGGGMGGHAGGVGHGVGHGAGPSHLGAQHGQHHQAYAHSKYYPPQTSTAGGAAGAGQELTWLGRFIYWFRRKNR
jgi:hypothetical protein